MPLQPDGERRVRPQEPPKQMGYVAPAVFPSMFQLRLSTGARVQIASVLVPGTVLLVEIWLLSTGTNEPLGKASEQTAGVSTWVLTFAALVVVLLAVLVGLLARSLAWPEFIRHERKRIERGTAPVKLALRELERGYGADAIDAVTRVGGQREAMFAEGNLDAVRDYCKGWLRLYAPGLSVDGHEIEIAFVVVAAVPAALLPFTVLRYVDVGWGGDRWAHVVVTSLWTAALIVAFALCRTFFKRARTRRREELTDAIRNYCLAHWYDEDMPRAAMRPTMAKEPAPEG